MITAQTDRSDDAGARPHEVVGFMLEHDLSLIAAWRKYLKMSQKELGLKMGGIGQSAVAQIEKRGSKTQHATLEKVAAAMGIRVEQLED